ncbi:hypothetical protein MC916_004062 [Elizabethkingia anophelis]|uniref:hypothetical protein n=1 Tax=Elizabethkingia anophelis TaxID=1117645 RepID=UPI001E1697CA|nr:hypothetical protein [Elizabethkingia anophelis]EHM7982815.1 hypothetical protein [Elizabethkingia anophelis]EHM8030178.1 hypothetical protein [Elizabethkingia anophelis]EHZ9532932.1 hypothetical protein [Elizabethkingia anophelis]EKU3670842.1 hypothetical protein [Elizabethkingia anophelis]EKU4208470.1 hypothetical protein [Elizabethkingia anophelis]
MAKINIAGHILFTYEYNPYKEIYWNEISQMMIEKYGNDIIDNFEKVNECLNECFLYFIKKFEEIVFNIDNFKFYCYVFRLHEDSLKLMLKERSRELDLFETVEESHFAVYRRILKIILEQGCKMEMQWGTIDATLAHQFNENIEKLYYIGMQLYMFADKIAYHRMLNGAYFISFEENDIVINWKNNYGTVEHHLMSYFSKGYETSVVDESGVTELRQKIEECYGIDYDKTFGIPFFLKKLFSANPCQTIEPYVLPINLMSEFGDLTNEDAENIYKGLSISKDNCLSLIDTILKPYSTERFLYRPFLIYNINNKRRLLTSEDKFSESIYVLATNAVQWNTLNAEWRQKKCFQKYINKKGNEHDKLLEDRIEQYFKTNRILFVRNIKSFKTATHNNINVDNAICGEIDFIFIDDVRKEIVVADSKYNKARYEAVGYRQDFTNFEKKYEPQLQKKIDWVTNNISIVNQHFIKIYNDKNIDFTSYKVIGMFLINTPTFYMFCSNYFAVDIENFGHYIKGRDVYPDITLQLEDDNQKVYTYPYFK